jgi:hypothetical protein
MTQLYLLLPIFSFLIACGHKEETGIVPEEEEVDDCEILEGTSCWDDETSTMIECPDGYECSGLSAFWCYRGECSDLPQCLPPTALISTPSGGVPASSLQKGMPVWTRDLSGSAVLASVLEVSTVQAPTKHRLLAVSLADGRSFSASPNHPDDSGKPLGRLQVGDVLDGAKVEALEMVEYLHPQTWDLLPSGETGIYKVNGVWLGSTLFESGSVANK